MTTENLLSSHSDIDLDSSILDDTDCSPNTKIQMVSLERKASQVFGQESPKTTSLFLKWRLAVVEIRLKVRTTQKQALTEASVYFQNIDKSKTELMAMIREDEKALLSEKTILLSQRKILEEDLADIISSKMQLEEAYIVELRTSLEAASSSKEQLPGKTPRLDRKNFQDTVNDHLGTKIVMPEIEENKRLCNVLGYWLTPDSVKCAHIVPYSWNKKEMAHMFGSDEPPLMSKRKGLSLQTKIEEAFDNCWVVVVPVDSVESNPVGWKVVLLNTAQKDKMF